MHCACYLSVFQLIVIFVQNMLPLQIVDSESFVDFVQTCIHGKRSLSRRTLTRRVEEKFSIEKTKLKKFYKMFHLLRQLQTFGLAETGK